MANPWRILRIAIMLAGIILLILATVVVFWGEHFFGPPNLSISSMQKDSNTTLNFTFGQPDKATPFSRCQLVFWIDSEGEIIRSIQTGINHPMILSYYVRPNGTYTVIVHDLNNNGRIDAGDYVTMTSSSSLATNEWYSLEIGYWARTDRVTTIYVAHYYNS